LRAQVPREFCGSALRGVVPTDAWDHTPLTAACQEPDAYGATPDCLNNGTPPAVRLHLSAGDDRLCRIRRRLEVGA
jgi:hypothetical protein